MAFAEDANEDAMAKIAAKNRAKREQERAAQEARISKNADKLDRQNKGSTAIIGAVAAGGTLRGALMQPPGTT